MKRRWISCIGWLCVMLIPSVYAATYQYAPVVVTLTGTLQQRMFYGPPGYGENPARDAKEPTFVLHLDAPIDVAAGDNDINVENKSVRDVQLVPMSVPPQELARAVKSRVQLTGTLFGEHTGHHHTPVLLQVRTWRRIAP